MSSKEENLSTASIPSNETLAEKLKRQRHEYYVRNKEKCFEQTRKWRATHPDAVRAIARASAARRKAAGYEKPPRTPEQNARHTEVARLWRRANPDRIKAISRKHYWKYPERNRERSRWNVLRWNYGITKEDFLRMNEAQKGLCAICLKPQEQDRKSGERTNYNRLHVDHNHSTGKIRGLLCTKCNHLLGDSYENITTLRAAIKYLEKWK